MAEKLESTTPPIQAEYNPEKKLSKKEIDKLPPKEKQRVLDSMAPEDFIPAGYRVDDIEFSNAIYKKLNLDPEKMESLRKARLDEFKKIKKNISNQVQTPKKKKSATVNKKPKIPSTEQAPDIEIKDAEAKLKLEIAELEKEITKLEIQEQELLKEQTENASHITNSEPETTPEETKQQEIVSENINIEEFQKDIDRIVRNNLGGAFEDNGLDYEKTVVKYEHNIIHTEIGFNDHKILLCFDLTSVNGETVLANDHWVQTSWHKIITLNKLNDKNAKSWCDIIMSKFIEDKSPKQNFHKLALDNGNLVIEQKI